MRQLFSDRPNPNAGPSLYAPDEPDTYAMDRIIAEYRNDDAKLRDAEQWTAGTFDDEHYTEVTLALHRLYRTKPSDLLGSDVLATLYRLARVEHDAIESQLQDMAEQELESRRLPPKDLGEAA